MDNEFDQSKVAYGNGPKEVADHKGMPDGNKQFGKKKMPQDSKKVATRGYVKEIMRSHERKLHGHGRHSEHR